MVMETGMFDRYLITVNIIGFILFAVNFWLYSHTAKGQINAMIAIVSLLGGSLGILLSILLFDRKARKDNMMSRIFTACMFVIQAVILLLLKGHHTDNITFAFWTFFDRHKMLIVYFVMINFITFTAFGVDKYHAVKGRARIRIVTLLGLAFAGGSLGGLLAMYLFRHKTLQNYFTAGIPLMIVMQLAVIFYIMNAGW